MPVTTQSTPQPVTSRAIDADRADERVVFVSDLHLSTSGFGEPTGRPSPAGATDAFTALVERVRSATGPGRPRLVLLGDTLELLDPHFARVGARIPTAESRLRAVAEANPVVFDALRDAIDSGVRVEVVAGNHDAELAFPSVQRSFTEILLSRDATQSIAFHPWIYYVPGVVYAEHGNQYHDLNAFGSPLAPSLIDDPERLDHPVGAFIDASLREARVARTGRSSREPAERIAAAATVTRGLARYVGSVAASRNARARERATRGVKLDRYADEIGLSRASVREIDALSRRGAMAIGLRAAVYVAGRVRRSVGFGARARVGHEVTGYRPEYLYAAAAAIHDILRRRREEVPLYVFGHSHVAERVPLPAAIGNPELLGTGTWTAQGPAAADLPARTGRFPWVEIERRDDGVSGRVRVWDTVAGREAVLA